VKVKLIDLSFLDPVADLVRPPRHLDALIWLGSETPELWRHPKRGHGFVYSLGIEHISSYRLASQIRISTASRKVIIEWDSNGHNGAAIAFGNDGLLFVTSGDGTSGAYTDLAGQNTRG
jgi:hypothetical protein